MPNWVEKLLKIETASQSRLFEIRNFMAGTETHINDNCNLFVTNRAIDFQEIVPVPTPDDLIASGENLNDWRYENWGTYWN